MKHKQQKSEPSLETLIFPFKNFCKETSKTELNEATTSFEFGIKIKNQSINYDWITFYINPEKVTSEFAKKWIEQITNKDQSIQIYEKTKEKYHPHMSGLYYFGYEKGTPKEFYYLYTSYDLDTIDKNDWNYHEVYGDSKLKTCHKYIQTKDIISSFINQQNTNTLIKKTKTDPSTSTKQDTLYISFEPTPLHQVKDKLLNLITSINEELKLNTEQLKDLSEFIEFYASQNKYNFTQLAFSIDDPSKFSIYIRHGD
jgi:hypothetical protein